MSDPRSRPNPDPNYDVAADATADPWPVEEGDRRSGYADTAGPTTTGSTTVGSTGTGTGSGGSGTTGAAKEQGSRLADEAVGGGQHVAQVAMDQASSVASEAGAQARNLFSEAKSQLSSQASDQKGSLVSYLKSFGDDLDGMVSGRAPEAGQQGPARQLAQRASGYAQDAASWLDDREPSQILDEVGRFARRRPGLFLLIAAAAGVLAGRVTRGLTGGDDHDEGVGYGQGRQGYATGYSTGYSTGRSTGYVGEGYPAPGYGEGAYADSADATGAGAPGYEVEEVVYTEEFGLPETGTGRVAAPGEPGYDDRGLR